MTRRRRSGLVCTRTPPATDESHPDHRLARRRGHASLGACAVFTSPPLIRETRETFGMTEKQLGTLIADLQAKGILG